MQKDIDLFHGYLNSVLNKRYIYIYIYMCVFMLYSVFHMLGVIYLEFRMFQSVP